MIFQYLLLIILLIFIFFVLRHQNCVRNVQQLRSIHNLQNGGVKSLIDAYQLENFYGKRYTATCDIDMKDNGNRSNNSNNNSNNSTG